MDGKGFAWALLLACFALSCAGAQAQESLSRQSSSIRENLLSIREQSILLSEELTSVRERLSVSEEERTRLEEQSTRLSASLTTINGQLTDSYRNITALETRLGATLRKTRALAAVLLVLIAMKIAGYVLYFKGVKLPRWLDILL